MSNPYRHPISTPIPELQGIATIAATPEALPVEQCCEHGIRHPHHCDECLDRGIPIGKRLADHPCYGISLIRPTEFCHRNSWPLSSVEHPYCARCGTEIEGPNNLQKGGAPLCWEPRVRTAPEASEAVAWMLSGPSGECELSFYPIDRTGWTRTPLYTSPQPSAQVEAVAGAINVLELVANWVTAEFYGGEFADQYLATLRELNGDVVASYASALRRHPNGAKP